MEDQRWTVFVCVCIKYVIVMSVRYEGVCVCVCVCVSSSTGCWAQKAQVWVCVRKQRAGGEPSLGNSFSVQAQPVEALSRVTHHFCHAAGVEDQRTHHFVQLWEKVWQIRQWKRVRTKGRNDLQSIRKRCFFKYPPYVYWYSNSMVTETEKLSKLPRLRS